MVDKNEFSESSLSEKDLDALLSSTEEDSTPSSEKQNTISSFGNIEGLSSILGTSEDTGLNKDLNSFDSSIASASITTGGDIQKSGIYINELYDINVKLTVELGRTFVYIKDILLLAEGSIVELDKNVGDEVDILINDKLFARGKLVILDEFYGVQITQILHPSLFKNL